jgi:hypothetical protein
MLMTANIQCHFDKGYIANPYWAAIDRLINIQKKSGINRAKSDAKRRRALEEHLKMIGMSLADYEALEKEASEPFYRDKTGAIIIPQNQVEAFLVATCHQVSSQMRPCEPDQVRSRFVCCDWETGKKEQDGVFQRFVTVTSGTGNKLSNQRGLRTNPFISHFVAHGGIRFDADFVDAATLNQAIKWGGMFVGIGASRKMGWGRFRLASFQVEQVLDQAAE